MRVLTSKDGDFLSHCDKIDESEAEIANNSIHHNLINNHDVEANKGKIKGILPLKHVFGFCNICKKSTKQLRFHLTLETTDLQDIIYTTLCDNI